MKKITTETVQTFISLASALLSIMASIFVNIAFLRIVAILVTICIFIFIIIVNRKNIISLLRWLTFKFVLGLLIGIILTSLVFCFFGDQVNYIIFHSYQKNYSIINTNINKNDLVEATERICMYFSENIPESERDDYFIKIIPSYPIELYWSRYDSTYTDTRELVIEPKKYYPNEVLPRFEYNTKYSVLVKSKYFKEPYTFSFTTDDNKTK